MEDIHPLYGRLVPPIGLKSSKIILIGESPGEEEIKNGRPFCGRSGDLLDRILGDVGLDRNSCYITNVVKARPPKNEFKWFRKKENRKFLEESIQEVRREIEEIKPNIVMCLGAEALAAVLGDRRISARRGFVEWEGSLNTKVMGTYHPAAVLRGMNLYPICLFDFKKMVEEGKELTLTRKDRVAKVGLTFDEIVAELDQMKSAKRIAFDIETTKEGIDCIGLATSATEALTVPFLSDTGNIWLEEHEIILWKKIKELLETRSIQKGAQNAFYDTWHLQTQLGIHVKDVSFDTMLAAGMVNPEFPKNLWFLASMYTDAGFWEDTEDGLNIKRWRYNATDAMLTFEIWEKQEKELEEGGYKEFYSRLPMPLLPCLVRASIKGVRFDTARRDRLLEESNKGYKGVVDKLRDIAGRGFNFDSYKQCCEYFITGKGIKPIIDRGKKRPTFDFDAMEELRKVYPDIAEFRLIQEARSWKNKIDVLKTPLGKDGRIRCSYNIAGTETGRLSSSSAPDGTGTNLQNITEGLRSLFLPDDGCVIVKADYKGADDTIFAYMTNDINMIRDYEEGVDAHAQVARDIIFCKKEISKQERQFGKKTRHATHYGMRPKRLQETAWEELSWRITNKQAKSFMDQYKKRHPGITAWHNRVQAELKRGRVLINPLGRKRYFAGYWGDDLFREAYAHLCQGTVADKVNLSIIELDAIGLDIRNQVHDEIVFNVRKEEVSWTVDRIKDVMQSPFKIGDKDVCLRVEIKIGENWGEVEEVDQWLRKGH